MGDGLPLLESLRLSSISPLTFVVVPDADLPHAAQASVAGDVEDVQAVACEGPAAVQVTVAAAALAAVQADADVGGGAWTTRSTKVRHTDQGSKQNSGQVTVRISRNQCNMQLSLKP